MSSILKALKKIEGRKVDTSLPAWPYGAGNLESMDRHIHRSRQRQKLLGLLIILCVAALAGKLYIGSRPGSEEISTPGNTVTRSPLSPSTTLSEKPVEVPPLTRKIVETTPESPPTAEPLPREAPAETAAPSTISSPVAEETAAETPAPLDVSAPPAEATAAKTPTPEITSPPVEAPSEAAADPPPAAAATEIFSPSPSDNAGLSLMALVWAEQPESRFVVINGIIVRQEGTIENSTVVRIEEDYVVMKTGGATWKLK